MIIKTNVRAMSQKELKKLPLYSMFQKVSKHYDLLNKLLTWGLDKRWRTRTVKECLSSRPSTILDLCTGTGDMALLLAKTSEYPVKIKAVDFSDEMLKIARIKLADRLGKDIELLRQNAADLELKDETFDAVTVSFAFRNMTFKNPNVKKHISEILRVLKPGGLCFILESSQPENPIFRFFYHRYIRLFAKPLGTLISKNPSAYYYLANSMINHINSEELTALLISEGFNNVRTIRFLSGITVLHIASKDTGLCKGRI